MVKITAEYGSGNLFVRSKDFLVSLTGEGRIGVIGDLTKDVKLPGLKNKLVKFLNNFLWKNGRNRVTWFSYKGGEIAEFEIGGSDFIYGVTPYKLGYAKVAEIRKDECGIYLPNGKIYEKLDSEEAKNLVFKILEGNKIAVIGNKIKYWTRGRKLSILKENGEIVLEAEPNNFVCYYRLIGSDFVDTKSILRWFKNMIFKSYSLWEVKFFKNSAYVKSDTWIFMRDFEDLDRSIFKYNGFMGKEEL